MGAGLDWFNQDVFYWWHTLQYHIISYLQTLNGHIQIYYFTVPVLLVIFMLGQCLMTVSHSFHIVRLVWAGPGASYFPARTSGSIVTTGYSAPCVTFLGPGLRWGAGLDWFYQDVLYWWHTLQYHIIPHLQTLNNHIQILYFTVVLFIFMLGQCLVTVSHSVHIVRLVWADHGASYFPNNSSEPIATKGYSAPRVTFMGPGLWWSGNYFFF